MSSNTTQAAIVVSDTPVAYVTTAVNTASAIVTTDSGAATFVATGSTPGTPLAVQTIYLSDTPLAVQTIYLSDTPLAVQTTPDPVNTTPLMFQTTPDPLFYTTPPVVLVFTTPPLPIIQATTTSRALAFTTLRTAAALGLATQTPIAATSQFQISDIQTKDASLIAGIVAVILFLALVGFTVFECISKIAKPHSTVNLTRLTGAVSGSIVGLFILGIADASYFGGGSAPDISSTYARIFGLALFEGAFCFCLVIGANPLLTRSHVHTFFQNLAVAAAVICGLSIISILVMLIMPVKPVSGPLEVAKYALLINQGVTLFVCVLYTYLLVHRLRRKLKSPRGNEEQLAKNGLFVISATVLGLVLSILSFTQFDSFTVLITVASRILLMLGTLGLISLKLAYNRGLIRRVGGKLVYSRGYSITNTEDMDSLTHAEKPKSGVGAMA